MAKAWHCGRGAVALGVVSRRSSLAAVSSPLSPTPLPEGERGFVIVPTLCVTAIKLSTNGVQGLPCEVPNYL